MVREVNLTQYIPPFMQPYRQMTEALNAENGLRQTMYSRIVSSQRQTRAELSTLRGYWEL